MSKCCGCNKTFLSNTVAGNPESCMCSQNGCSFPVSGTCTDVCTTPQCGDPKLLTVLIPVIYDEIGVNVCRTIPLANLLADYPTAAYIRAEVTNITLATGATPSVTIKPIAGRPNCYEITLSNLTVDFVIYVYDCCKRLLATLPVTGVVYLPTATTDPNYDADTNPTSVTMQLFAPYGTIYTDTTVATPNLNVIGFLSTNSAITQGFNLMAMSKVLDFNIANAEMTVGLTLIVKSIYYNQYRIPHNGKAIVSKGTLSTPEDSVCMNFVSGSLLDRNIKPLELCNPLDQKQNCESCTSPDDCACLTPND